MEKEPLYDWSDAPDWAKWAATDRNGKAYWYEKKPIISTFPFFISKGNRDRDQSILNPPKLSVDWENSLQQRPK